MGGNGDQRIGEAELVASMPRVDAPLAGQDRRTRAGLDELDRLQECRKVRIRVLRRAGRHLADHDLIDDRFVSVLEQAPEPHSGGDVAAQHVDKERGVQQVAAHRSAGPGSVSIAR